MDERFGAYIQEVAHLADAYSKGEITSREWVQGMAELRERRIGSCREPSNRDPRQSDIEG